MAMFVRILLMITALGTLATEVEAKVDLNDPENIYYKMIIACSVVGVLLVGVIFVPVNIFHLIRDP